MTKLQLGCGPWALKTNQINFMILNSTTQKGNRNLMKIFNLPKSVIDLSSKNVKTQLYPSKYIDISSLVDGDLSIIKNSLYLKEKIRIRPKLKSKSVILHSYSNDNFQIIPHPLKSFRLIIVHLYLHYRMQTRLIHY